MRNSEMRLEGAERSNQNARRGFLADPASAPAPLQGPFLERVFPAEDMPQARPRRRSDPADRLHRTPHRRARRLDAQPRAVPLRPRAAIAEAQMRQIERTQWVEVGKRTTVVLFPISLRALTRVRNFARHAHRPLSVPHAVIYYL
jgi:hypothetical protein